MIFDQIASQKFTLDGSIQRRRELHKLFYTPRRKRVPVPVVEPVDGFHDWQPFQDSWLIQLRFELEALFYLEDGKPMPDSAKMTRIKMEVSVKHQIAFEDIIGKSRKHRIINARHEAFYRAKNETNFSLSNIGRLLGGFDHSTVFHGVQRHAKLMGLQQ